MHIFFEKNQMHIIQQLSILIEDKSVIFHIP